MTSAFGGAGVRVGDGRRRLAGLRRVVQVPAGHPGLVDPGGEDAAPVRRPPVAAEPAELLGADELGQPPGHRRAGLAGEQRVACRRASITRSAPPAARRRPGARSGPAAGRRTGPARAHLGDRRPCTQVGPEQPAAEREDRDRPAASSAYEPMPPAIAAAARAAPARRRAGRRRRPQCRRVGDQPLRAGGHVEHPQRVGRVLRPGGAQEHHPRAVGGRPSPRGARRG